MYVEGRFFFFFFFRVWREALRHLARQDPRCSPACLFAEIASLVHFGAATQCRTSLPPPRLPPYRACVPLPTALRPRDQASPLRPSASTAWRGLRRARRPSSRPPAPAAARTSPRYEPHMERPYKHHVRDHCHTSYFHTFTLLYGASAEVSTSWTLLPRPYTRLRSPRGAPQETPAPILTPRNSSHTVSCFGTRVCTTAACNRGAGRSSRSF